MPGLPLWWCSVAAFVSWPETAAAVVAHNRALIRSASALSRGPVHADQPRNNDFLDKRGLGERPCNPICSEGKGICNDGLCFCRSPYEGAACQHEVVFLLGTLCTYGLRTLLCLKKPFDGPSMTHRVESWVLRGNVDQAPKTSGDSRCTYFSSDEESL
eukprot:GEMP01108982.1.p1 GENE.GEMP01108982.1~~GEMP01108982.1.p1  ORF type:complete len:158 (+),score=14.59 GEMP01108982.1:132-605(+)